MAAVNGGASLIDMRERGGGEGERARKIEINAKK